MYVWHSARQVESGASRLPCLLLQSEVQKHQTVARDPPSSTFELLTPCFPLRDRQGTVLWDKDLWEIVLLLASSGLIVKSFFLGIIGRIVMRSVTDGGYRTKKCD